MTQGPPGTGKSYFGVVIVQALLIIRKLWISVNPSVGKPPILVLSYKNHAIDEFLRDLIKAEKYNIDLVRIGGSQNDDPDLQRYSEYNLKSFKSYVHETQQNLKTLFNTKNELASFQKVLSPLIKFKAVLMQSVPPADEAEAKNKNKAGYAAAIYLQNVVVRVKEIEKLLSESDFISYHDLKKMWNKYFLPDSEGFPLNIKHEEFETLWMGIKHYDPQMQVTDILLKWICDFKTLPPCTFKNGIKCTAIADSHSTGLCDQHQCHFWGEQNDRCTSETILNHTFCLNHACGVTKCLVPKMNSPQIFCHEHACFICIQLGKIGELSVGKIPKNTCKQHDLCMTCNNLALLNSKFCDEHQERQCSAITKKGFICKSKVISKTNLYCTNHQESQNSEKSKTSKNDSSHCEATTVRNKPCKAKTNGISNFCQAHFNKINLSPKSSNFNLSQSSSTVEVTKVETESLENIGEKLTKVESPNLQKEMVLNLSLLNPPEKCCSTRTEDDQFKDAALTNLDFCKDHAYRKNLVKENSYSNFAAQPEPHYNLNQTEQFEANEQARSDIFCEEPLPDEEFESVNVENTQELEEPVNLQHFRDVFYVQEPDIDFIIDSDEPEIENVPVEKVNYTDRISISKWNWEMTIEERWFQCQILEESYFQLIGKLDQHVNELVNSARQEHHVAKVNATTKVYEGNSVIGGTIVGCISRLQSIRSTNPFAIVVEEASEVLEPLLFACIGSTTCKLELIGDHLQLKPSLMTKFSFDRVNKANFSMFKLYKKLKTAL